MSHDIKSSHVGFKRTGAKKHVVFKHTGAKKLIGYCQTQKKEVSYKPKERKGDKHAWVKK